MSKQAMPKHQFGPWTLGREAHGKIRIDGKKHAVAEVFSKDGDPAGIKNARLMTAATDLYDVVHQFLSAIDSNDAVEYRNAIRAATVAVAKAEGRLS